MNTNSKNGWAVRNIQTGLLETENQTLIEAIQTAQNLGDDFETVFVADGVIYSDEREYINS